MTIIQQELEIKTLTKLVDDFRSSNADYRKRCDYAERQVKKLTETVRIL